MVLSKCMRLALQRNSKKKKQKQMPAASDENLFGK